MDINMIKGQIHVKYQILNIEVGTNKVLVSHHNLKVNNLILVIQHTTNQKIVGISEKIRTIYLTGGYLVKNTLKM